MLKINNITKIYNIKNGKDVVAIRNISLDLPAKGMVFIIGKSGSGKSTLLNLIGGLDVPTEGQIVFGNESVVEMRDNKLDCYRNSVVGFVFQDYNLINHLTVGENIALAMELQNRKAEISDIKNVLSLVDLDEYQDRKMNELSGGQKQRIAIARALIKNPYIIIADEPTGAVDSSTGNQLFTILKNISKEKLVIIVSHDVDMANRYADRIIELRDGEIVNDSVSEVYTDKIEVPLHMAQLPTKSALKHGIQFVKKTKIRFVFVVLLSIISFVLFGSADMIASYNQHTVLLNSLYDSGMTNIVAKKEKFLKYDYTSGWYDDGFRMEQTEIDELSQNSGMEWKGVYKPALIEMNIEQNYGDTTYVDSQYGLYITNFSGFVEFEEEDLSLYGFNMMEGRLPSGEKDEIAISKYMYESFMMASYKNYKGPVWEISKDGGETVNEILSWDEYRGLEESEFARKGNHFFLNQTPKCQTYEINCPGDLIGKTVFIGKRNYTITGIVDTGFDSSSYKDLPWRDLDRQADNVDLEQFIKIQAIENERNYGTVGIAFVGEGKIEEISLRYPNIVSIDDMTITLENEEFKSEFSYNKFVKYSDLLIADGIHNLENIINMFDEEKGSLDKREIINPIADRPIVSYDDTKDEQWNQQLVEKSRKNWNLFVSYDDDRKILEQTRYELVGFTYSDTIGMRAMKDFVDLQGVLIIPDELFEELSEGRSGTYNYIISPLPKDKNLLSEFIRNMNSDTDSCVSYTIQGKAITELEALDAYIAGIAEIFCYVSYGIAFFAMLMLFHFMSNSVIQNRREIGIMRAMGARNVDVCKIFLCESLFIAIVNTAMSSGFLLAVAYIGNRLIKQNLHISLSLLQFGSRQLMLLAIVTTVMAVLSCVLPARWIMKRKPIEIINLM